MASAYRVSIQGGGIAAYCCALLLRRTGIHVSIERSDRPMLPAIMLNQVAVNVIREVFDGSIAFLEGAPIRHRVVAWGERAAPLSMDHAALVVSEEALLASLDVGFDDAFDGSPDFTVFTANRLPERAAAKRCFGSRLARTARILLRSETAPTTCFMESVSAGWLFLLPDGGDGAWLLAVGASIERMLDESRIIAPRIDTFTALATEFETCPALLSPVHGSGWLACGTAAARFDPICGDGAAHAVRAAILASASIVEFARGASSQPILSHYESVLTAAMRRHLDLSAAFYRTGGDSPWWRTQHDALREGYAWCGRRLAHAAAPAFRLEGFELVAREAAPGPSTLQPELA